MVSRHCAHWQNQLLKPILSFSFPFDKLNLLLYFFKKTFIYLTKQLINNKQLRNGFYLRGARHIWISYWNSDLLSIVWEDLDGGGVLLDKKQYLSEGG